MECDCDFVDKEEPLSVRRDKLLAKIGLEVSSMKREIHKQRPTTTQKAGAMSYEGPGVPTCDDVEEEIVPTMPVPDTPPDIRLPCCPLSHYKIPLTPTPSIDVEVIMTVERSMQVVARLQREKIIAVATEGINIGREGPLTLLQVGLFNGSVFIFDVLENRDLIDKGRLKTVLENDEIVKVMYNCSAVSAALSYQFATTLQNVFDTQIAHLLMEEHKGRRLPEGLKLSEMCLQYADNTDKYFVYDWRTDSKSMWMALIGNFWAVRPLTKDMIDFAAGDVIVLVPDVYRNQNEYLEENGLVEKFLARVEEELQLEVDDVVKETRGKRVSEVVDAILGEMDGEYGANSGLHNVLDQDHMHALALATYEDAERISPVIGSLKRQQILQELENIDVNLRMGAESWELRTKALDSLRYYCNHQDRDVKEKAESVLAEVTSAILEHMAEKHNEETTIQMLSSVEKDALQTLPYTAMEEDDQPPTIKALYWKLIEENVHLMINELRLYPQQFVPTKLEYQILDSFAVGAPFIPETVSNLSMGLLAAVRVHHASNGDRVIGERRRQGPLNLL